MAIAAPILFLAAGALFGMGTAKSESDWFGLQWILGAIPVVAIGCALNIFFFIRSVLAKEKNQVVAALAFVFSTVYLAFFGYIWICRTFHCD